MFRIKGTTERGKPEVGYAGYIYQTKKQTRYGWLMRCKRRSCHITTSCNNEMTAITVNAGEHTHPPEHSQIVIRQWLHELKVKADHCFEPMEKLYKEGQLAFVQKYPQFAANLPVFKYSFQFLI